MGQVRLLPSLGGPVDPVPGNDSAIHRASPILLSDLRATALSTTVHAPQEIAITARFANHGPSRAPNTQTVLRLPHGYTVSYIECLRGALDCGAQYTINGTELIIDTLPLLGDSQDNTLIVHAGFAGATPPLGLITLDTALVIPPDTFASDPNLGNNSLSIATPSGPPDRLFANGFE